MRFYYNVPQILQNPELPNGCEITSMCELLNYYGYSADKCDLADNYLPQSKEWYGADPDLVYLGNPRLDGNTPDTGYYCFAGPVMEAASRYIAAHPSSGNVPQPKDLTGADENDLIEALRSGHPFVFWASLHFDDIQFDPAPSWTLSDGTVHKPFHMLHCMVCRGVDDEFFYIADPLDYNEKVPRAQFMKIFRQLGSRAVILSAE
ncbi:MAG: C39 family peptidase [Parasporobacterium sp.]|nr:C39 family peptidase [Parasporobacterium sp.]